MSKIKTKPVEVLDMVYDSNRGIYTTAADRDLAVQGEIKGLSGGENPSKSMIGLGDILLLAPIAAVVFFHSPLPLLLYVVAIVIYVANPSWKKHGVNPNCRRRKGRTNLPLADCRPGASGLTYHCNR